MKTYTQAEMLAQREHFDKIKTWGQSLSLEQQKENKQVQRANYVAIGVTGATTFAFVTTQFNAQGRTSGLQSGGGFILALAVLVLLTKAVFLGTVHTVVWAQKQFDR